MNSQRRTPAAELPGELGERPARGDAELVEEFGGPARGGAGGGRVAARDERPHERVPGWFAPRVDLECNYAAGQTGPNGAVVELLSNGTLCVFTKASVHVLVDVAGYLPAGTDGLHAMAPERLVDTRPGGLPVDGLNSADAGRLSDGQTIEIQVAGPGSARIVPGTIRAGWS